MDLSCNKWYKSERHSSVFLFFSFLSFFLTTLETKLNNGRPRWSILSCSRNFRVIPEALPLLCQLVFSNHGAAEHLVFCVQCSCHRSVIEKWNQVHSSRPVIINAMQSLLYWPFSECYSCFNVSFYQIKAPTKQSSLPSVLGNRDNALGKLYSDYLYWHDPEPHNY